MVLIHIGQNNSTSNYAKLRQIKEKYAGQKSKKIFLPNFGQRISPEAKN